MDKICSGLVQVNLFLVYFSEINSALHLFGVAKSSTSFGWGKGGKVTAAGWQVTSSDPMWHVISHSCVIISITNWYVLALNFTGWSSEIFQLQCCVTLYYEMLCWYICSPFNDVAKCFRKKNCRMTINHYGIMRALEFLCWTANKGQFRRWLHHRRRHHHHHHHHHFWVHRTLNCDGSQIFWRSICFCFVKISLALVCNLWYVG